MLTASHDCVVGRDLAPFLGGFSTSGDLVVVNLLAFEGVVSGRYESNDRSSSSTFLL